MKSLAALLFHPAANADRADKARGPKPADSFAQVLQASLGDSRRDSRPGLAPTPPADNLPKVKSTAAPNAGVAQDRPTEEALEPARTSGGQRVRGRSEAQVGQDSSRPESGNQDKVARPTQDAPKLHQANRGYAANPTRQASDAHPPEARRSEMGQGPLPSQTKADIACADEPTKGAPATDASVTQDLPTPSLRPRRLASVDHAQTDPRTTPQDPPMPLTGAAVIEPSPEKAMPPSTSAVAHAFANPGVPSARSGVSAQPQAWTHASHDIEVPTYPVGNQGALAVPAGQLVPVDTVAPSPLPAIETSPLPESEASPLPELATSPPATQEQASASQPEPTIQPAPVPVTHPARPKGPSPITPEPVVLKGPSPEGLPLRRPSASNDAVRESALPGRPAVSPGVHKAEGHADHHRDKVLGPSGLTKPERPVRSDAPSVSDALPSASLPNLAPPELDTPPPVQAESGEGLVVGEPTSAGEAPVMTSPPLDPIAIPESRLPGEQPPVSRPQPETAAPSRSVRQAASVPPNAIEPQTAETPPALPDAPRSIPHTSLAPKLHVTVQPSTPVELAHPALPDAPRSIPHTSLAPKLHVMVQPSTPVELAHPALPDAPRSIPHTSLAPKLHVTVQPSTRVELADPHTQTLPRSSEDHGEVAPQSHATAPADAPAPKGEPVVALPQPALPPSLKPALASRGSQHTPEANASFPMTQVSVPLPPAKPFANHGTTVVPVAIKTPDASATVATGVSSRPATTPLPPPQPKAVPEPATPVLPKLNHGTQVAQMASPAAPKGAHHERSVTRPTVEDSPRSLPDKPSVPVIQHHSSDGDRAPRTPSTSGAGPVPPVVLPSKAKAAEVGPDQPARPVTRESIQDKPVASTGRQPLPLPRTTGLTAEMPAEPKPTVPAPLAQPSAHNTAPPARIASTDPRPAQPRRDGSAPPQIPVPTTPVSVQTQVASKPSGHAQPAHPATPDHGVRIAPPAPRSEKEPVTASSPGRPDPRKATANHDAAPALPIEATPSTAPTQIPTVLADSPVAVSAPDSPPAPQPTADHEARPAVQGFQGSQHPGPHRTHPKSATKPVEASASKPQGESQPEPTLRVEDQSEPTPAQATSDDAGDAEAPLATTTTPSVHPAPSPVPVAPVAPAPPAMIATTAPTDKPAPRVEAPAVSSAVQAGPALPAANPTATIAPSAPASPETGDARAPRRLWAPKEDPRFADAAPAPAPAPQQARPHAAPAPTPRVSDDPTNSTGNQGQHQHASAQPALPSTSDRPAELPAPPVQASSAASDTSVVAPAPTSPSVGQAPPVEVQRPHLPSHMAPLVAQADRVDGLSMTVMPHSAHMSIESSDGDLALHLRIRDGSADITVGGSMAPLFETRGPEARAALAGEGLNLGRFDLGQQGGGSGGQQGQPAPERSERAPESPTPYRHQTSPTEHAPSSDGRIHVTA